MYYALASDPPKPLGEAIVLIYIIIIIIAITKTNLTPTLDSREIRHGCFRLWKQLILELSSRTINISKDLVTYLEDKVSSMIENRL